MIDLKFEAWSVTGSQVLYGEMLDSVAEHSKEIARRGQRPFRSQSSSSRFPPTPMPSLRFAGRQTPPQPASASLLGCTRFSPKMWIRGVLAALKKPSSSISIRSSNGTSPGLPSI